MNELIHTKQEIHRFAAEEYARLKSLYNPARYTSVQELKTLMEIEDTRLLSIQKEITSELRKRCYEGLRADGVKHPESAWALHIGSRYTSIYLQTIRSEAVQEKVYEAQCKAMEEQRTQVQMSEASDVSSTSGNSGMSGNAMIGGSAALAGVACVVVGFVMSPISVGLIALGVVMTAGGSVIVINQNSAGKGSKQSVTPTSVQHVSVTSSAVQMDEKEIVKSILNEQLKRCTQTLNEYCKNAYKFACEVEQKAGDNNQ